MMQTDGMMDLCQTQTHSPKIGGLEKCKIRITQNIFLKSFLSNNPDTVFHESQKLDTSKFLLVQSKTIWNEENFVYGMPD